MREHLVYFTADVTYKDGRNYYSRTDGTVHFATNLSIWDSEWVDLVRGHIRNDVLKIVRKDVEACANNKDITLDDINIAITSFNPIAERRYVSAYTAFLNRWIGVTCIAATAALIINLLWKWL